MYSHGFNAADLSLGPYRNAVILNTILERQHFDIEKERGVQIFRDRHELPDHPEWYMCLVPYKETPQI